MILLLNPGYQTMAFIVSPLDTTSTPNSVWSLAIIDLHGLRYPEEKINTSMQPLQILHQAADFIYPDRKSIAIFTNTGDDSFGIGFGEI